MLASGSESSSSHDLPDIARVVVATNLAFSMLLKIPKTDVNSPSIHHRLHLKPSPWTMTNLNKSKPSCIRPEVNAMHCTCFLLILVLTYLQSAGWLQCRAVRYVSQYHGQLHAGHSAFVTTWSARYRDRARQSAWPSRCTV